MSASRVEVTCSPRKSAVRYLIGEEDAALEIAFEDPVDDGFFPELVTNGGEIGLKERARFEGEGRVAPTLEGEPDGALAAEHAFDLAVDGEDRVAEAELNALNRLGISRHGRFRQALPTPAPAWPPPHWSR